MGEIIVYNKALDPVMVNSVTNDISGIAATVTCQGAALPRQLNSGAQMRCRFFADLPERMAQSHLVIARSGASTIAELTVLGRPAILVPLPGSIDADQKNNALVVDAAGGGWIMEQARISPPSLGTRLSALFGDPGGLAAAAAAAKSLGQPRAVEQLADLAEAAAGRGKTE